MGRDGLAPESIGQLALTAIGNRRARLRKRGRSVLELPTAEAVHQLRVAARRLRAALTVFDPVMLLPAGLRPRPLRRMERRFGRLRDGDVLLEMLAELEREHLGPEAIGMLQARLAAERQDVLRHAQAQLHRRSYRRSLKLLRRWVRNPLFAPQGELPAAVVVPDLLLAPIGRLLLHPGWRVGRITRLEDPAGPALHSLRRRIKSLRYVLECVAQASPADLGSCIELLCTMQAGLGTFHDHVVLCSRLRAEGAPTALTDLVSARGLAVIEAWDRWRWIGADPVGRADFRSRLLSVPPPPPPAPGPATVAPASVAAGALPGG